MSILRQVENRIVRRERTVGLNEGRILNEIGKRLQHVRWRASADRRGCRKQRRAVTRDRDTCREALQGWRNYCRRRCPRRIP